MGRQAHGGAERMRRVAEELLVFPRRAAYPREIASLISHVVHNKYINATVLHIDAGHGYL